MPPASSSGGASRSTRPIRDVRLDPSSERQPSGSSSPRARGSARALFGETGPPLNTTEGPVARSLHGSSTCPTSTSVGRFRTTPRVPSPGSSSTIMITVLRKFGSPSNGVATRSRPPRDSASMYQSCARGRRVALRRGSRKNVGTYAVRVSGASTQPAEVGQAATAVLAGAPVVDVTRLRVAIARLSRRLRKHELAGLTPTQLAAVPADARAWRLAVTPRGHEVLEQIRQENTLLLADSLLTLSTDQLAALAAALPALERLADGTPQHSEAEAATVDGASATG